MLLAMTALLLPSKSLIQTSQILTTISDLFVLLVQLFLLRPQKWNAVCLIFSLSVNPIVDSLIPLSSLDFMIYHLCHCTGNFYIFFSPSVLTIHLSGKTLFLYEMMHLSYLCLAPGNWVLLERITQRTNWYHYKWWLCASTVPWVLSRNSNAGLYSALTQTLRMH